jgi:hypothetical protein
MSELQLYGHTDPSSERAYKTVYIGIDHAGYAFRSRESGSAITTRRSSRRVS